MTRHKAQGFTLSIVSPITTSNGTSLAITMTMTETIFETETKKIMENLLSQLSPENWKKYANAVAEGANEAHFCFAGGTQFYRYDIEDINRGMNAHRTQRLSLRLVKISAFDQDDWEEKANLVFWNSFVDDRLIFYS